MQCTLVSDVNPNLECKRFVCWEKRSGVKDFCLLNKFDVVCFEETKLDIVTPSILRSFWASYLKSWSILPAIGATWEC